MIGARASIGLALALAVLAAPVQSGAAVTFGGTVTNIHDGDTFRFGQVRVRIAGMDAPELETRFGPGSRDHLVQLIAGQRVTCQDSGERSYDRVVATCWNYQGVELGDAMVRDGWAVDWPKFSHGRYAADEQAAIYARRGIFGLGGHPWRWGQEP